MRKTIPNLRDDQDTVTLDHCYVLMKHLSEAIDLIEGIDVGAAFTDELDPTLLQDCLQEMYDPPAFSRLFKTPMGKGVLVGTFVKDLYLKLKREEHDE